MTHTQYQSSVAELVQSILEPLCEETAKFLKPAPILPNDRLRVELTERGNAFVVQPYAVSSTGEHVQASWHARRTWLGNVPERHDLKNEQWELAATDITCLVINANWREEQLDWEPEAKTTYEYLITRFLSQTVASRHRANFKVRRVMPPMPGDWLEHPTQPLADYQKVGVVTMLGQEGAGQFGEQGTGKTPIAIARMCLEARRAATPGRMFKVLLIAPKNVRANWVNEIAKFATVPGKATVLKGGQLKRLKLMLETIKVEEGDDSEFGCCIMSFDGVKRSWEHVRMVQWDMVIVDESHYMKGRNTDRAKTLIQLRNISSHRVIMTGTPVCNSVLDLYAQLEFLGEGMSGFTNAEQFKKFYCQLEKARYGDKIIGYQNMPFLQERLARLAFRITKKEALPDLPDKKYDIREVEMSTRQIAAYTQLAEQLRLEIEEGTSKKTMTAQHILTKLLRLAQITSGILTWDAEIDPDTGDVMGERAVEYIQPNPKLEELIEIVRESGEDEKLIVWACFKPDITEISKRLTAEGIPHGTYFGGTKDRDREQLERDFNRKHARDMKVFVGNAAAGGTGLNLRGYEPDAEEDHGCNVTRVVYYSQNWSMVYRGQSEDRAHRRGTRVSVQYTDLVVLGTIDETIRERVMRKTINSLEIQDVFEIMKQVLNSMPEQED